MSTLRKNVVHLAKTKHISHQRDRNDTPYASSCSPQRHPLDTPANTDINRFIPVSTLWQRSKIQHLFCPAIVAAATLRYERPVQHTVRGAPCGPAASFHPIPGNSIPGNDFACRITRLHDWSFPGQLVSRPTHFARAKATCLRVGVLRVWPEHETVIMTTTCRARRSNFAPFSFSFFFFYHSFYYRLRNPSYILRFYSVSRWFIINIFIILIYRDEITM